MIRWQISTNQKNAFWSTSRQHRTIRALSTRMRQLFLRGTANFYATKNRTFGKLFLFLALLFDIIFYVQCLFMWPYLQKPQQINGRHNQNSGRFNLSSSYIEEEKRQMAFLLHFISFLLQRNRLFNFIVSPQNRLPALCCCLCWDIFSNVPVLWFANMSSLLGVILQLGLAYIWHHLTARIRGWMQNTAGGFRRISFKGWRRCVHADKVLMMWNLWHPVLVNWIKSYQ